MAVAAEEALAGVEEAGEAGTEAGEGAEEAEDSVAVMAGVEEAGALADAEEAVTEVVEEAGVEVGVGSRSTEARPERRPPSTIENVLDCPSGETAMRNPHFPTSRSSIELALSVCFA